MASGSTTISTITNILTAVQTVEALLTEAPSPFLPGTNVMVAWDSTSLGMLKTCSRLYKYVIIDGWQSKEESVHLRFGIEYHHALQDYDLSRAANISHDDAVHDVVRELLLRTSDFDPDHKTKTFGPGGEKRIHTRNSDVSEPRRLDRVAAKHAEFRARVLGAPAPATKKRARPKRKIPNRPFPKRKKER